MVRRTGEQVVVGLVLDVPEVLLPVVVDEGQVPVLLVQRVVATISGKSSALSCGCIASSEGRCACHYRRAASATLARVAGFIADSHRVQAAKAPSLTGALTPPVSV